MTLLSSRTLLSTMLRGLRSRALLTGGSVVLVALAVGSAVLGPVFADAVTRSYAVSRLDEAPAFLTSTSWLFTPATLTPLEPAEQAAAAAVDAAYPNPMARHQIGWETRPLPGLGGQAWLLARPGACEHLTLAEGRCPTARSEVLLATVDLAATGHQVTDQIEVGGVPLDIVGSYLLPTTETDFWPYPLRLRSRPASVNLTTGTRTPYSPAPLVTTPDAPATLLRDQWAVRLETVLDPPADLTADDIDAAADASRRLRGLRPTVLESGQLSLQFSDDLPAVASEVRQQQRTARASIAPAALSLVLVALALLSRLLLAASELRVPELALASLRGSPVARSWALGLAEPLLILVIATPLGIGLGLVGSQLLARAWLVPGLPLRFPWASAAGAVAVVVTGVAVAAVAVGTVLRVSLAGQLTGVRRPVATRRYVLVGQLLLVALTLAVVSTRMVGGDRQPDLTDLVLPLLLALVAGLGAGWLVTAVAGWWVRGREGGGLTGFLATRALSRRREGTLVVVPLTAAIAIGVFSLGVYDAAANWRSSIAATRAPAAQVWSSPLELRPTYSLTHTLDPDGRWLMAGGQVLGLGGNVAALDLSRLERVGEWPDAWVRGLDTRGVVDELAPDHPDVWVTGRTLTLTVDRDVEMTGAMWLELELYPSGSVDSRRLHLGPYPQGRHTRTVRLAGCGQGCRWESLAVAGPSGVTSRMVGRVSLVDPEVDGRPEPALLAEGGWSAAPDAVDQYRPADVTTTRDGLDVAVDTLGLPGRAQLTAGPIPSRRPAIVGLDAQDNLSADDTLQLSADVLPVEVTHVSQSVPFFGPEGVLVDLRMFSTGRPVYTDMVSAFVLARDDTPATVLQALADRGLTLQTTRAGEERTLGRDAYALALRLYLVVAVLVLVMAFAGLAVGTAVQLPARRRDAAALRVVGVRRGRLVRAAAVELGVALAAAAVAGIAAGLLAQDIVLRTVTLGVVRDLRTPPLQTRIDTGQLALWTAGLALALAVVAVISAALVVRGARGATLRESAR